MLTAHDLVDVEGIGLDLDASVQPQSAVNQSSLLRLRLGHGLAQPGSSDTSATWWRYVIIKLSIFTVIIQ